MSSPMQSAAVEARIARARGRSFSRRRRGYYSSRSRVGKRGAPKAAIHSFEENGHRARLDLFVSDV